MKKTLLFLGVLTSLTTSAGDFISAESLAKTHSIDQVSLVADRLGVQIYDGPYDGEIPTKSCEVSNVMGCVSYNALIPGVSLYEIPAYDASQDVEDYIYYSAYRNVMAGYYTAKPRQVYKTLVSTLGLSRMIEAEIFLMKSGQKAYGLFTGSERYKDLVNSVKEVY
ncbi:hypothetical protein HNQ57_001365 [Zhongshania antarctica]|uniref:Uncharacterized protein n=1 Tax=Zhongshania antarctica TaxID=641702 RepID=A0A840R3U3_9GAMM|nr:hypothetical protein [Zhongshania antarctica]MBB5187102.1 hypothetical protein [Zhongshania antarctica]